jgi:hypothetical protein
MRPNPGLLASLIVLTGCVDGLTQVAGTGALYHTRCSSEMAIRGVEYRAQCVPENCAPRFTSGSISHVVVAVDPGKKIVGYAERVCIQDLSEATGLFNPAQFDPETNLATDDDAGTH